MQMHSDIPSIATLYLLLNVTSTPTDTCPASSGSRYGEFLEDPMCPVSDSISAVEVWGDSLSPPL